MAFSLKKPLERELSHLEGLGILQKVKHSVWAVPVVVLPKGDGYLRVCVDYKQTINPVLVVCQGSKTADRGRNFQRLTQVRLISRCNWMKCPVNLLPLIPTRGYINIQEYHLVLRLRRLCSKKSWTPYCRGYQAQYAI